MKYNLARTPYRRAFVVASCRAALFNGGNAEDEYIGKVGVYCVLEEIPEPATYNKAADGEA